MLLNARLKRTLSPSASILLALPPGSDELLGYVTRIIYPPNKTVVEELKKKLDRMMIVQHVLAPTLSALCYETPFHCGYLTGEMKPAWRCRQTCRRSRVDPRLRWAVHSKLSNSSACMVTFLSALLFSPIILQLDLDNVALPNPKTILSPCGFLPTNTCDYENEKETMLPFLLKTFRKAFSQSTSPTGLQSLIIQPRQCC